ncbi:uncharacterized protein A1O9_06077 [Exophiala aquamarina CBS 119918]|uniref:NACHT domain-containing protein n=1 Tax=Exophiala aquamarina CBS 119918 TaxID=1182545 RepID=A0A072PFV1_9EURO|nr:uncharacterized protein A1O9_06077 [Exophiala aquamarina CBS 119918]KEF58153.1 hypothetical protein A1O9_06077 [Exophiala aquamarina CBS 119918]
MKKFIKQIGKRHSRREDPPRQTSEPDVGQTHNVEQNRLLPELQVLADHQHRYGLRELPSLPEESVSDNSYELSVVAVHGLGGDFYQTWASTDAQRTLWLSQLLPEKLPRARIFSFGYASAPTFSKSVTGISDSANDLLHHLMPITEQWPDQPIIFICHSLGGIIVKQAMISAHENDYFSNVLRATRMVVFMGTPHRGSQIAAALGPLAAFANFWLDISFTSLFVGSMRTDLIRLLSRDSAKLDEINESFKQRAKGMTVISCYERVKPPGSSSLVVDKQSSLLHLQDEIQISIEADHMGMCRFSSRNAPGYEPMIWAIVRAVKQMMPDSSHRSFTESENKYIAAFGQQLDVPIDEPLQGTCLWSISTQEYRNWYAENRPAVLWLTGEAGCGKTVLTNFLIQELRAGVAPSSLKDELVCCFFCTRDIELQKDARSLLRALILQILTVKKDVVRQIKTRHSSIKHEYEPSFETLWHIFEMAVETTPCSCLYIVIDALDECEEKSRALLLTKLLRMFQPRNLDSEVWRKKIKLIISGQPLISRTWKVRDESLSQFHINMEGRPEGLVRDLQRFVEYKVEDLVYNAIFTEAFGEQLKRRLYALAENSFLWLSVVLEDLKHGLNYRDDDVQRVLTSIPSNLKDSYAKHLPPISRTQLPRLRCYLQLLVASARPLTLFEIDIFTTLFNRQSTECISPVDGALVLSSLRRALGPLIKFPDGKVQLIHSTVKEFFLILRLESDHPLYETHGVDLEMAHLQLAKVCMQNILQEANSPDDVDEERVSPGMASSSPISVRSLDVEADQWGLYGELYNIEDVAFLRDENTISESVLSHLRTRYPGYDYSSWYWDYHYGQAEHLADAAVQQTAAKLLSCGSAKFSRWYKYKANHSTSAMPDPSEGGALVLAALFDFPITLRSLLSERGLGDDRSDLQAALYWASSRGHLKSMSVLLEYKSPLLDASGSRSALAVTIRGGFTEACELLLRVGGADPNYSGLRTPPPLVLAAAHNHVEILIELLQHENIDINQADASGRTSLMQACNSGADQCLKELLRHDRSRINSCDNDGRNALIHACMANHAQAVQQLLREPLLNVHLCDKYDRNAMSYAAERATLTIVRCLFHAGVSIGQKDVNGRNAVSWAASSARATKPSDQYGKCVLEYLVEKCPHGVDSQDNYDWSPLAWALDRPGYPEAVRILVEKGRAAVNPKDKASGRSVLAWAAGEGSTEIVEYLLGLPYLDKNATDGDGRSPLSYAAANGMIHTVELLLRYSDVIAGLRDSKGRSPLDWARMNHQDDIVSLLSEHGLE